MSYYNDLITEKSWQTLQGLRAKLDFILIGGWAVYLHVEDGPKSKDIDLVLKYPELEKLKHDFTVYKNTRLKKYEARDEATQIDIYVPHYSDPGIPAQYIFDYSEVLDGIKTVNKETLVILKQQAFFARYHSPKGRKDLIDLLNLFKLEDFNWQKFSDLVKKYHKNQETLFMLKAIKETRKIEEIGLNEYQMSKIKKLILQKLMPQ